MKRLIAATVALTMLGSTAAMAHDYRGYRGHDRYDRYSRHHHHSDVGPAIAVGLGVAALAIIASSQSDHHRYERRGYYSGRNGYYYRNRGEYERHRQYYGDRGYYHRSYYGRGDYSRRNYHRGYDGD